MAKEDEIYSLKLGEDGRNEGITQIGKLYWPTLLKGIFGSKRPGRRAAITEGKQQDGASSSLNSTEGQSEESNRSSKSGRLARSKAKFRSPELTIGLPLRMAQFLRSLVSESMNFEKMVQMWMTGLMKPAKSPVIEKAPGPGTIMKVETAESMRPFRSWDLLTKFGQSMQTGTIVEIQMAATTGSERLTELGQSVGAGAIIPLHRAGSRQAPLPGQDLNRVSASCEDMKKDMEEDNLRYVFP